MLERIAASAGDMPVVMTLDGEVDWFFWTGPIVSL